MNIYFPETYQFFLESHEVIFLKNLQAFKMHKFILYKTLWSPSNYNLFQLYAALNSDGVLVCIMFRQLV